MVDAAVSFVVETLGNLLIQEGKLLYGLRDEVKEMQSELEWMKSFLMEAEKRKGEGDVARKRVYEIREAAYNVEDMVERFFLKSALRNEPNDQKGVVNSIKKYACCFNQAAEYHQAGSEIKAIKAKLTTLRTRWGTYGMNEHKESREEVVGSSTTSWRKRQDYLHIPNHSVVGLDGKISELVQHLLDDQKESVVYLYGMGGLGKTTTAKQVFKNANIKEYFEGVAWVYISQQFNPEQVWKSILTQLSPKNKEEIERMSTEELPSQLYDVQKEKNCLVVIDDIWHKKDWDKLSAAFPYTENDNKSKILLTSRNRDVVASDRVYRTSLDVLNDSCSLDLLKNTILSSLGGRDHPIKEDSKMPKCAEEMVKQCGGLPLAIVVLGGILATKRDLHNWERVGANIKSVMKRREQEGKETLGVSSVLESSYEDLPHYLRSCFLYFSQYREDEEIKATELKQKWIGEGFILSSVEEGDETMEDIAEEYLDELVCRCLIQVGREGHTGRVKTCHMHDLMREFCISEAKEEGFAHTIKPGAEKEGTNLKEVGFRRLCISSGNHKLDKSVVSSLGRISPQLRSIRFQENLDDDQLKEAVSIVEKLKLVRVLELPCTMGESGREHIGNLIHLRFLNLEVSMLPTSIGNLICLHTLNLGRCSSNLIIPNSVWRMELLRHLYLPKDGGVCESEKQVVCDFKNLQTLVNFPPKNFDLDQNLVKFINVRKLVMTEGSLEICNILQRSAATMFSRVESLSYTYFSCWDKVDLEAVTRSCPNLYRLFVCGAINLPGAPCCSVIWPSNLTKLVLRHSWLHESHVRSLGKLHSLKVLFLYCDAFKGKKMIFQKNDFPQLHHLLVEGLEDLQSWAVDEGGLPSLCCLEIINCPQLESVPDGFQYLKHLNELKVSHMPYVFREKLEKGGEDWERVRNVSSISFSHCYREYPYNHGWIRLDKHNSLELLKKTIFCSGGPDHPIGENSKMDTSAIEMVKICGGVRVAITILGGVLATKHGIEEWKSIELVLKEGEKKGNHAVTSVLELSYKDLPSNLRSCFLYSGQYEKDEKMKATEMILTWIGEGFVTSSMEDDGREYLNELVSRGLIEAEERSHRGRVKTCRMHEFVRRFCVSKAEEEGFALSLLQQEGRILEEVKFRRLCIYRGGISYKLGGSIISSSVVEIIPQLVSVLFRYPAVYYYSSYELDDEEREAAMLIIKNLKSVKVLTVSGKIWNLLDESGREQIGNLVHLTFLRIEGLELPKSLGNLRCLQTLNLERCAYSTIIPDSVWGMGQLRHLYLPNQCTCETSTQRVGDFSNLQTLVNFPPRNFDLEQNLIKFTAVRKLVLTDLAGKICSLMRSQNIVFNRLQSLSYSIYQGELDLEAFTRGCPCLYRLYVRGSVKFPAAPSCNAIWPSSLTKLVLIETNIDQSHLGSLTKLQSLQVLFLQRNAFTGKEIVFHKNDFPQLHHLRIDHLENLETWAVQKGALSNLLCLEIADCQQLKSIPNGFQHLKQLKDLKVRVIVSERG